MALVLTGKTTSPVFFYLEIDYESSLPGMPEEPRRNAARLSRALFALFGPCRRWHRTWRQDDARHSGIEQSYHDFKKVDGWGKQQVRRLDSNIGCMTVTLLKYALVELWAWYHTAPAQAHRQKTSPWDDTMRRPSHDGNCRLLRQVLLDQELLQANRRLPNSRKILLLRSLSHLGAKFDRMMESDINLTS